MTNKDLFIKKIELLCEKMLFKSYKNGSIPYTEHMNFKEFKNYVLNNKV